MIQKFIALVILSLTLAYFCEKVLAQQSIMRLPRDSANNPLIAGLGEPYLFEPTVTVTAYDVTVRSQIPQTGNDQLRQYRHITMFNPDTVLSVYACMGDSTGCLRDWFKVRPGQGFVDDFTWFGVGNLKSYIYYRLSAPGSVQVDVRIW